MDSVVHEGWSGEAAQLRRRTRFARQGYWFPMVVFGILVLASEPFLRNQVGTKAYAQLHQTTGLMSGANSGRAGALTVFWLIGARAAYLLTVGYYRLKGRHQGVATSTASFVAVGLGLYGLLVVLSVIGLALPAGDAAEPGLLPLVTFGVGFCVLAWAERSIGLGIFAACLLGVTISMNVVSTVIWIVGGHQGGSYEQLGQVESLIVGSFLLLGGLVAGAALHLRTRRPG